jgi:hypothetical protein
MMQPRDGHRNVTDASAYPLCLDAHHGCRS